MSPIVGYAVEWKGIDFFLPGMDVSGVWVYDVIGRENLIGIETPFARISKWRGLTLTAGFLTDAEKSPDEGELREKRRRFLESGTPFFGAHIPIKERANFLEDLLLKLLDIETEVDVGGFLGRNLIEGKNVAGIKCSVKFW